MSFLRVLLNPVHVPNTLYIGLPWYCFLVTGVAWTVVGTHWSILAMTASLSIYAIIILIVRVIEVFN